LITETAKFDSSVAELDPKRCLLRMNRDARFTKNKPPYHSAFRMALSKAEQKELAPAYYFNYEPGNMFMGGGLVGAPTATIKKVRQEIDYNWKEFEKIIKEKNFKSLFDDLLKGEENSLKTTPKDYEAENPAIEYLKLKNFVARRWLKKEDFSSKELLKEVVDSFKACKDFLDFINTALK
jgi:uncharacterized protein (TIGR02453 family)